MVASPVRRSSRKRNATKPAFRWRNLCENWRRQYLDLGHCRLQRCSRRLLESSDFERQELRKTGLSFVAMAISSAASAGSASREGDLVSYVNAAIECDLNIDDVFNSDSALSLASYYGYTRVLKILLDGGHALKNKEVSAGRSALFAAVRNGQHKCLEMILRRRAKEARGIIEDEKFGYEQRGYHFSTLLEAITKGDSVSVQLLLSAGVANMSDIDCKWIYGKQNTCKRFQVVLQRIYPCLPSVMHWRGELHWSFPTTDRETLNWLWHSLHRPSSPELLPDEMWKRVLSFVGRGWFASRRYQLIGSPGSEILQRNVI